ncbi:hypothetical protein [Micromonospora sp. NPDC048063]|uniref:hypothetical protein n=1 Tax=Micromonospora sp. NPDC048063 TaxID=3364256 RepID=UPI003723F4D3
MTEPSRLLTDDELRAAAATRPGYATYPQYRPQPERLGQLPAVDRDLLLSTVRIAGVPALLPPVPEHCYPPDAVDLPEAKPDESLRLVELPPSPVFEFQPHRSPGRPWWRPRWSWAVMPAKGPTTWGYCWTEAGARRRTARAARRAECRG